MQYIQFTLQLINKTTYRKVGLVINPITWTRDDTLGDKTQGLGSFLPNNKGEWVKTLQYADARVDIAKGVLSVFNCTKDFMVVFMLYLYNIQSCRKFTRTG